MLELINKILEEVRGAWRFRLYALLIAWAVCLLGWTAVLFMPDVYQSSARIFVDSRTALSPVLTGLTIQQDVVAQLNLVRQSLASRPLLERVAREANVGVGASTPGERMREIEELAKRIQVNVRQVGGSGAVFQVTYQDRDRDTSLKVVQLLLNTLIEDTLGGKRVSAEVAQKFLRDQIADYERRLRDAEERLADFKRRNVGLMPGTQGDYFSRLQDQMTAVNKLRAELSVAMKRREELARQLRGEGSAASASQLSAAASDTTERIKQAQAKLDDLLLQYTEKHPDILNLRETIKQLEERRNEEVEQLKGGQALAGSTNPVLQSIQLSLNQTDVEIAGLRGQIADGEGAVARLRNLVNTAPEVEAEFARLNRDYDVTKSQYTALVDRAERARLGDEAEATESVRFEVVDPPSAAFRPVGPNRPRALLVVLMLAIGAGCGIAYLLHQFRPVFTSVRTLTEVTGLPVLGIVSRTWLEKHRLQLRRTYVGYALGMASLLVCFALMLRFSDEGARYVHALVS